jgi:hypothetical protein
MYERKPLDGGRWEKMWREFEDTLRASRHFNRRAEAILREVFESAEKLSAADGRPVVVGAGPGTDFAVFFRARRFATKKLVLEALTDLDRELGPPPSPKSGRMNARGVSVFYGATEQNVAAAEVRPPVGSYVAVARFSLVRKLRLLDLSAMKCIEAAQGSLLDPGASDHHERAAFLGNLTARVARPVMPEDEETDYVTTQVFADYFANCETPEIDGILYPSGQSQDSGLNVVLFHKSSRVKRRYEEGAHVLATGQEVFDGGYMESCSIEIVPPGDPHKTVERAFHLYGPDEVAERTIGAQETDPRQITLEASRRICVLYQEHAFCPPTARA